MQEMALWRPRGRPAWCWAAPGAGAT
ncbi:hypothetical protein, partial [Bordetella pertussis]